MSSPTTTTPKPTPMPTFARVERPAGAGVTVAVGVRETAGRVEVVALVAGGRVPAVTALVAVGAGVATVPASGANEEDADGPESQDRNDVESVVVAPSSRSRSGVAYSTGVAVPPAGT